MNTGIDTDANTGMPMAGALALAERERLEVDADFARSRLVGTLAKLEDRGRRLLDIKGHLRRNAGLLVLVAGAVAMLTVGRILRWGWQRTHLGDQRLAAMDRAWRHPERIGR